MRRNNHEWGTHLYRLFLLGIMFGVLWKKEYLWSAFVIALLLFLGDTLIIPALQIASNMPPENPAPRRPKSRRQTLPPSPPTDEDADGPAAGGGDDFREPMPGRPSPRRKGS
jgi:hypothetical protein